MSTVGNEENIIKTYTTYVPGSLVRKSFDEEGMVVQWLEKVNDISIAKKRFFQLDPNQSKIKVIDRTVLSKIDIDDTGTILRTQMTKLEAYDCLDKYFLVNPMKQDQTLSSEKDTVVYSRDGLNIFYNAYIGVEHNNCELTVEVDGVNVVDSLPLNMVIKDGYGLPARNRVMEFAFVVNPINTRTFYIKFFDIGIKARESFKIKLKNKQKFNTSMIVGCVSLTRGEIS